jgi:predicted nucleic acid-binding protein
MKTASRVVIDASVAIAIARDEPTASRALWAIEQLIRQGARPAVPTHFWLEVVNSLSRRHRWPGSEILGVIHQLDRLRIDTIEVDRALVVLVIDVAERHGLSAWDAAYVALAASLDAPLATLDSAMRRASGGRALDLDGRGLAESPAVYEHEVTWPDYKGASAYLARLRNEARAGTGAGRLPSTRS